MVHRVPEVKARKKQTQIMAQTQNRNQIALQPWTTVEAELMGNDRAVKPLVEFLQATEIGSREGSNERSKEWESRVDGEGEEDL